MQIEQLTIIGVGLIGGSVGLAAKARGVARRVVGVDHNPESLKKAEARGAIDSGTAELAEAWWLSAPRLIGSRTFSWR
jgi:cyclohexadieny/prephenate dehydrogenase